MEICEMCEGFGDIIKEGCAKNLTLCQTCYPKLQRSVETALSSADEGGYDCELFLTQPPSNDHFCSICLQVYKHPMQIVGCGHVFCQTCLHKVTRGENEGVCPLDMGGFTQAINDKSMERMVMALKVRCKYKACEWKGDLSNLQFSWHRTCCTIYIKNTRENKLTENILLSEMYVRHNGISQKVHLAENCKHVLIKCTDDNCQMTLEKGGLFTHLKTKRLFRPVNCEFCQLELVFKDMKEHVSACPLVLITCTFNCQREILRKDMKEHGLICKTLDCPFRHLGCSFEGSKQLMDVHLKEDVSFHLERSTEEIERLKQTVSAIKATCEEEVHNLKTMFLHKFEKQETAEEKQNPINVKKSKRSCFDYKSGLILLLAIVIYYLTRSTAIYLSDEQPELGMQSNQGYTWIIEDFSRKFQVARDNQIPISRHTFTSSQGYKFELLSKTIPQESALFICAVATKGKFDPVLKWPFANDIRLAIFSNDNTISKSRHVNLRYGMGEFSKEFTQGMCSTTAVKLTYQETFKSFVTGDAMFVNFLIK